MINRPSHIGAFEFVILAALRTAQLTRGCVPKVDDGPHRRTVIAQLEVSAGLIAPVIRPVIALIEAPLVADILIESVPAI